MITHQSIVIIIDAKKACINGACGNVAHQANKFVVKVIPFFE